MTSLILDLRQRGSDVVRIEEHLQQLPGGLDVLVSPLGADSATALDAELGKVRSRLLPSDVDVIADLGRLTLSSPGHRQMLEDSDSILLMVRPDGAGLAHARWTIDRLSETVHRKPQLTLFDEGTYSASDAEAALGTTVVDVVPHDPKGAAMAAGGPGRASALVRSPLIVAAKRILTKLLKAHEAALSETTDEGTSTNRGVERGATNDQSDDGKYDAFGEEQRVEASSR